MHFNPFTVPSFISPRMQSPLSRMMGNILFPSGGLASRYTLRVDPINGNDSYTYAQVHGAPDTYAWASKVRAFRGVSKAVWEAAGGTLATGDANQAAQAGDIVMCEPDGAESVDRTNFLDDDILSYYPINEGSVGSPIIFLSRYRACFLTDAQDSLRTKLQHHNNNGHLISERPWVYYDGFYLDEDYARGTADAFCYLNGGGYRGGYVFCNFRGMSDRSAIDQYEDNHALIFCDTEVNGNEKLLLCNKFERHYTPSVYDPNEACVVLYDQTDSFILHNEFDDSDGGGIFDKADNGTQQTAGGRIAFNIFKNLPSVAIEVYRTHYNQPAESAFIYQNLFYRVATAVKIGRAAYPSGEGHLVCNNTIDGSNYPSTYRYFNPFFYGVNYPRNNRFKNNLITNVLGIGITPTELNAMFVNDWSGSGGTLAALKALTGFQCDRNYFANISNFAFIDNALRNLAYWQDSGAGFDVNSVNVATDSGIYEDIANRDYRLAAGAGPRASVNSPALDIMQRLGGSTSDPIDCGAYITGVNEVPGICQYDYSWHYNGGDIPRDAF